MPKDISIKPGDRFGKLVFIERVGHNDKNKVTVKCLCDCGKEKITTIHNLKRGKLKSCGCLRKDPTVKKKSDDIIGKKFGRLTVLNYCYSIKGCRYYTCVCDCGNFKNAMAYSLKTHGTTSCGCARKAETSFYFKSLLELIGKRFNNIVVIDVVRDKTKTLLKYKCDCGKIGQTTNTILKKIQSCGCLSYKGIDTLSGVYFTGLKNGAKNRNIDFDITIEDVWDQYLKQNKKCALTGEDIVFRKDYAKSKILQTASVDRIDSLKGYVKGNIQILHKHINQAKWDFSQDYFIEICKKITDYQKQKDTNK